MSKSAWKDWLAKFRKPCPFPVQSYASNGKLVNEQLSSFHIHTDLTGKSRDSFVEIDGKKLHGVLKVSYEAGAELATTVTLTMLSKDVEVDGEAIVRTVVKVEKEST